MNKKLLIFMWFILNIFVILGFSFAQNTSIWDVSVKFCNNNSNTKSLWMVLDAGKEWEICMEFSNFSDDDVDISYGFVDGVVTSDKYKSKACKNEWDNKIFGQYVKQEINKITIPSMSKVRQKAYIKFPAGLTGMINGCLTYFVSNVKDTTTIDSAMFDVLVRKASFIDVLVWWKLSRNLKLSNDWKSINSYYDSKNDKLVLELKFDNAGTVNEGVVMNWTVSNIFGYNAIFSGNVVKVVSDSSQVLRVEIDDIPWYKWPFNINLNIESNPEFDFDSASIPDDMKESILISAKTSAFIIPWILIYILWWLLILIILIKILVKHIKFQ